MTPGLYVVRMPASDKQFAWCVYDHGGELHALTPELYRSRHQWACAGANVQRCIDEGWLFERIGELP